MIFLLLQSEYFLSLVFQFLYPIFYVSDVLLNLFNNFSNCVFHFQNFNLNLSLKTDYRPLVDYSALSSIFLNMLF